MGKKNTAMTNCALIAKVLFVGDFQVSGCTVKHRVSLSQRCGAQCDRKTWKNALKYLALATCLLQAQRSQLKILKNSIVQPYISETYVLFSLFFTPPPHWRSLIARLKRAPGRSGAAPHRALYGDVQRLGVGAVKRTRRVSPWAAGRKCRAPSVTKLKGRCAWNK